ncbi:MAG: glycosyltransferase family 2 protein [Candidatus Omnitrophota bacterium]
MLLSVVIPARNEEASLTKTVLAIVKELHAENIDFEIVMVDDGSTDSTYEAMQDIAKYDKRINYVRNHPPHGFGLAVRRGLEVYMGDAVVIVMADGSDEPKDIVKYYKKLEEGYDCVFGSRFVKSAKVVNYPYIKYIFNRAGNIFIKLLLGLRNNDITNAFKCYRREVIEGVKPLLSHHFNLTVEMPLKAIVRGYTYATVPINWYGRVEGVAKFKIKEMGSRYMFIIFYVLLEKWLSRGDYLKKRIAVPKNLGNKYAKSINNDK